MSAFYLSDRPTETVAQFDYQAPEIGKYSASTISVVFVAETIPTSFLEALEDFNAGRVIDMEQALNEPPPADA